MASLRAESQLSEESRDAWGRPTSNENIWLDLRLAEKQSTEKRKDITLLDSEVCKLTAKTHRAVNQCKLSRSGRAIISDVKLPHPPPPS